MARDAFGNYIADISPIPVDPLPSSMFGSGSGVGVPNNADGNNGDLYVNISNGDIYSKSGDAWHLAVAGTAGAVQVIAGVEANPNGNYEPDDPTKGAFYTRDGSGLTQVWRWDVTDQVWYQVTG